MQRYLVRGIWWMASLFVLVAASVGVAAEKATGKTADEPPSRPPIVLISLDTLRADHLGCYGYERDTSPALDELARESVLFEQYLSTGGGTLPVHMSMFTSLHPTVHGVLPSNGRPLPPSRTTLAEQLSAEGYETVGFADSGYVAGDYGFSQGFGLYDDEGGRFRRILPKVYRWLDAHHDEPFFLFIHTYDVHSQYKQLPYDSPEGFNRLFTADYDGSFTGCVAKKCASTLFGFWDRELVAGRLEPADVLPQKDLQYVVGLYDGGIRYVDRELGRLFEHMKTLGIYDGAMIVVTSDHGEEFLEHGRLLHGQGYEEIARIPLIVKLPGAAMAGRRIPTLHSVLDLMPTLLDLVGIDANDEAEGRSLLPVMRGEALAPRDVRHGLGRFGKLRTEEWSYMRPNERIRRPRGLFRVASDPLEQDNLIEGRNELADRLERSYERMYRADLATREAYERGEAPAPPVQVSPEHAEKLRGLGYLQ